MAVSIAVQITTPINDEDRDLLAGIATFSLALAQHQFAPEEEQVEPVRTCGVVNPDEPDQVCVGRLGHRGRHRFRHPIEAEEAATNEELMN